jgi:hypothetical protein
MSYPADHMYIATYGVLPLILDPYEPEGPVHKVIYQYSYPTPDPNVDGTMFYGWEIHALNVINQIDTTYTGSCTISMTGGGRFITPDSPTPVNSYTVSFVAGVANFGMGYTWKYLPAENDVYNLTNTYTVKFEGGIVGASSSSFKFVKSPLFTDLSVRKISGSNALTEIDIDLSQTAFIEYEICVSSKSDISYEGCASWPVIATAQVEVNNIPDFLIYTGSKVFTFDYKGKANLGLFTFAVKKEYLANKDFILSETLLSQSNAELYIVSNSTFPGKGIYQAGPITINFLSNEDKNKTFETPPRFGIPARLEDINRLGEKKIFTGSAIVGSGLDPYDPSINSNSQEPISSTFSSAGAFYYPLDLDNSPTIYYLPKHHCAVHGSLTKPYNVLASRAFENPKVLSRFLSAECIAIYEKLDIMLCAPNKYEVMNNRPEQLIGSTEGRDKINCEWPLTGELGIHSYVASIAPVVIKNYESGYDREICSFPCEGFFPACSSPSLLGGEENSIEQTHVKIPCTLARSTDVLSGESILTVAVAITNFGFSPVVKEDEEWWINATLWSYVFGIPDPLTGKLTTFCPYTSRTQESMLSRTIFPSPTSFGNSYVAYNGRNVSYGVLRSDKFAFQVASPDAFSNAYEPFDGYVWRLNTHFNLHFCSVQKTSKEPVPSYTYFQIPAAYADTRYAYDPNNLMEHDADKVGDQGYMYGHGRCIEYPKGYKKKVRSKDLNNLEKGCIELEEGYWSGREFHGREQYYCVIPMIEPAGCTNIKADGAPGSGAQILNTNNIASIDTIKEYAASVKNTKTSGPPRVKEELFEDKRCKLKQIKLFEYNYFVKPEDFQGGKYFYFHIKCHPYAGVDYLKLTQKYGESGLMKDKYDWSIDASSVELDLALLEKYAGRYNKVVYHHFPSDPESSKDKTEIDSTDSASQLQRTNCSSMKQSSKALANVFFNCYNTTFEKTVMATSKKDLAAFIYYEFVDDKSKAEDIGKRYKE